MKIKRRYSVNVCWIYWIVESFHINKSVSEKRVSTRESSKNRTFFLFSCLCIKILPMRATPFLLFHVAIMQIPSSFVRGSENLCEGSCFKRLMVQATHHLFTLCLEACMYHVLLEWATATANFSSLSSSFHHCPALPHGGKKKRKEKKKKEEKKEKKIEEENTCILQDQRNLIWSHSWGCYGDGWFWPSGCRSFWCWGKHWVAELWMHRCRESTRESIMPPCLRKWLARSAPSPQSWKAFLMESQLLNTLMKHYLVLPTALSMLQGSGVALFPPCANGSPTMYWRSKQFASESSEFSWFLGAQFSLW